MKKVLALTALATMANSAFADSSYITGNLQFHDSETSGVKNSSTIEVGHKFDTNTSIYMEVDAIPLSNPVLEDGVLPYITFGIEQAYDITDKLWVAAGYQHVISDWKTLQYRPLLKIGYDFENNVSLSSRVRFGIQEDRNLDDQVRFDNTIAYEFKDYPIRLAYNNIFVMSGGESDNTMDHEFRATWTRKGIQPYVEFRSQAHSFEGDYGNDALNKAYVIGASLSF